MTAPDYKIVFESELLDQDVERIAVIDRPIVHLKTPALDSLLEGVRPLLNILGGEPGAGKTHLALQIAEEAAEMGMAVLFFSLEIERELLVMKSLSRTSGKIPVKGLPDACASRNDELVEALGEYRSKIAGNIAFFDDPAITVADISIIAKRLMRDTGKAPLVVVDYVQIVPQDPSCHIAGTRVAVAETVHALRRLVSNQNVPVFAISSIVRGSYKKERAGLDSLAESASLEYTADRVLFLSVKGEGQEREENVLEEVRPVRLSTIKDRYSSMKSVDLIFDTRLATFREC